MSRAFSTEERALLRGARLPAPDSLQGWYPVVTRSQGVWWRYLGDKRFLEPFFQDTLYHLPPEERYVTWTPWDALEEAGHIAPSAFVFHISRCGSTLLTQLLATRRECIVLSEPPAIDGCLRPEMARAEMRLRQIVAALGQRRSPAERHLVIKLDSWHIGTLSLFRRAFPCTPFIFLYRRPAEVLASHRRQRGRQMVPGLVEHALEETAAAAARVGDLDGYCAAVLEQFFVAAGAATDDLILLDYSQLPQFVWTELSALLDLPLTEAAIEAMRRRAAQHSKSSAPFTSQVADATAFAETLCAKATVHYERMEEQRLARLARDAVR